MAKALSKGEILESLRDLLWSQGNGAFEDPAIFCDSNEYEMKFTDIARRKFSKEFPGD